MTTNLTPPQGYFDATKLFVARNPPQTIKVSHFLDNDYVKQLTNTLDKPKISSRGHYGYTWLRNELRTLYLEWLDNIGSRLANKSDNPNTFEVVK